MYAGFGSMAHRDIEGALRTVLAALRQTRQRGILATGWGGLGSSQLPDEVLALESVPHDWLFPQCAAVVHQGGHHGAQPGRRGALRRGAVLRRSAVLGAPYPDARRGYRADPEPKARYRASGGGFPSGHRRDAPAGTRRHPGRADTRGARGGIGS